MATKGSQWYLLPRAMGRWQRRLMVVFVPLLSAGFGFAFGWSIVHFPGRGEYIHEPAPQWLLWTGFGCLVAAVGVFALARLTSPVYDSDGDTPSEHPVPVSRGCLRGFVAAVSFVGALAVCSVAATSSDYRWRPLWLPAICAPVVLLFAAVVTFIATRFFRWDAA